ncbi:MAG TPA: hypothetical protein PLT20_14345 [Sedimentisphaerales bacterium]|nr:hypothetical protein [Sedimentisphaerales bacterium]
MRLMKLISEETAAKGPVLILDHRGYHIRVAGAWHHGLTREESRLLLLDAGIDDHDACLLLESAAWWPKPMEVEYKPTGRRHWLLDGQPVTKEGAAWEYRRIGMTFREIRCLMRIQRLCYEIEQRLNDCMTVDEARQLLADGLAHALSLRVARHWAREHLRPAECKHPLSLACWQERFERDKPKRSITQDEFVQVLTDVGVRVVGDKVYCEEIEA